MNILRSSWLSKKKKKKFLSAVSLNQSWFKILTKLYHANDSILNSNWFLSSKISGLNCSPLSKTACLILNGPPNAEKCHRKSPELQTFHGESASPVEQEILKAFKTSCLLFSLHVPICIMLLKPPKGCYKTLWLLRVTSISFFHTVSPLNQIIRSCK